MKAILFDSDGTLVDSEQAHFKAWQYALEKQGFFLSLEEYFFYVGKSIEAIGDLFAEKLGKPCAKELVQDKRHHYREVQKKGLPPIQETVDFVRRLALEKKEKGFLLAVASADNREAILVNLDHLGITNCFDLVLSGVDDLREYEDPEGVNKPKPYIYLHAAKMLGLFPEQCVAIEDSKTGVVSAVDAGCIVVAVPNACTIQHDLSYAHLKITSFKGISPINFLRMAEDCRTATVAHKKPR